jgi:hypothetical protein
MALAHARRHFLIALGDLGFALALFACGLFGATATLTGLAAGAMIAYWSVSRRRVLRRLPQKAWASQMGIALGVIIAIAAGAYWLGLGVGGYY